MKMLKSISIAVFGLLISWAAVHAAPYEPKSDESPAEPPEHAAPGGRDVMMMEAQVGFPQGSCRAGYFNFGPRLCMRDAAGLFGAQTYANAAAYCRSIHGRVATYEDWRYNILFGTGSGPFVGDWLGQITADNTALYVNSTDTGDFEAVTGRFNSRFFFCAHDDDV